MKNIFLKVFLGLIVFISLFTGAFADAPVITDFSGSVDENSAIGTSVLTHTGSDADGDTLTYSILSGNTGSVFSIDSNTAEITVSGSVDYDTIQTYDLVVEVSDGNLTDTGTITIDVIEDVAQPVFSSITTTSNNTKNVSYAKAGDNISFSLTIDPEDTWAVGNKAEFSIGTSTGLLTGDFNSNDTPKSSENINYTILDGQNGSLQVTDIIFQDWEGNTLTGFIAPASNIVVDTLAPVISFSDDIEEGPVQEDILNISITELNTDTGSYKYAFTDNQICDSTITFTETFVSGSGITFNDETNNGKYICVRAEDAAGNISYLSSNNPINIDISVPTINNLLIVSNNTKSGSWAKVGDKIIMTVEFSEEVNSPEIMILNNTGSNISLTQSGTSNIYIAEYNPDNQDIEGYINYKINVTDIAGNAMTEVLGNTIIIFDRTIPNFSMNLWNRKNSINMNYKVWDRVDDPGAGNPSDNFENSGSLIGENILIQDNRPAPGPNITGNYTIKYKLFDAAGNTKYLTRNVFIYGSSGGSNTSKKMDVCNETGGDKSGDYYDGKCLKDKNDVEDDKKEDNKLDTNEIKVTIKRNIIKYTNSDITKYKAKKENVIKYKDLIEKKYSEKISKISKSNYNKVISRIDNVLENIGKYNLSESKKQSIIELLIALKETFLSK